MITRLRLWFRSVVLRRRLEREMQEEMAEHIERSTERLITRGLVPEAARREAIREFGNVGYLQEEARIARGTSGLDALQRDLRFASRHFTRNLLSSLTIVAVLSIGISINVVLFTMVYSFDQPPSGIEPADALVRIRGSQLGLTTRIERAFTLAEVEAHSGLDRHFSAVAGWTSQPVTAGGPGMEEMTVTATFVTDDYFAVLGVQPVLGPGLGSDAVRGAVLSHAVWTRSFAADPGILGRTITLNDVPFLIVGVAPPRFRGAYWESQDGLQVWLPVSSHRSVVPGVASDAELFRAVARLRPGITRKAATGAVGVVAGRTVPGPDRAPDQIPSLLGRDPSADVAPLLAGNVAPGSEVQMRVGKLAFGVLGLLTLLVTCANVSTLQTGLALARRREIAVRMSLGASRFRVVRQLVTESLLLAVLAAGAAAGVSFAIFRMLLAISGHLSFDLVFDRTILSFTVGVALAAGLLFGISPALHATRVAITGALSDSATSIAGGRARLQRGLVVAQIALTQPLAVCVCTLIVFGLIEYRESPRNLSGEQIVQLRLGSTGASHTAVSADSAARELERVETDRLIGALLRVPGVTGVVQDPNRVPINQAAFTRPEAAGAESGDLESFYLVGREIMPGYLGLIGVPILVGRDLESADTAAFRAGAIPVIIGDDMARSLWNTGNPIGRRVEKVTAGLERMTLEVVGVYQAENDALGHSQDNFMIFLPSDPRPTSPSTSRYIMLRASSSAETMMPVIRGIVRTEVPRAAITGLRTLASLEDEARFTLVRVITLFATAGFVVLLLSGLGLYAVVAFAVRQRVGEIAVRVAMGARARQIVQHFASDGLRLCTVGIVLGLPFSLIGLHWLLSLSPGVPDVSLTLVTAIVGFGVLGVSSAASWIPARGAAEVDPAAILRRE